MKEIGSEYWKEEEQDYNNNLEFLNLGKDYKLLMSGSTAIDFVLQDIDDKKKIVYMPNYCCESMVRPFLDNNYKIKYYNVDLITNKYDININEDCSIFFAMSYFGYVCSNMDTYIQNFNDRKIIVLEDITHRLFCNNNYCNKSDYLIASLRKWFPIYTGGVAIKLDNKFRVDTSKYEVDNELISIKKQAMQLKKEYINGSKNNKEQFLKLFSMANELIENYKNKLMDIDSVNNLKTINIENMRQKRKLNVKTIEENLKVSKIKLVFKLTEKDCPLFVPIIINNRDNVRKELIQNNIYCPVHWSNFNDFDNNIYNEELSLICDQRYGEKEIKKYINKLVEITERN